MSCSAYQILVVTSLVASLTTTANAQRAGAVAVGASPPGAPIAGAPAAEAPSAGFSPGVLPLDSSRTLTGREILVTTAISTSTAATGMLVGGAIGGAAGFSACVNRNGDASLSNFLCLFNSGFVYGAFAGTFAGAAVGASGGGIRAGCPSRESLHRAFLGSLLGSLPAIAYITSRKDDLLTDERFAAATPILQIAGATFAVSRCRVR